MEAHYVDLYPPHNFASISYPSTRTLRNSSAALAPHASSPAILHPQPTTTSVGPLLGCTFYLDMSSEDPRKSSTERQLKQLAARVEDLFNGDIVTHLITTRHLTNEQKLKIQQQALSPSFSSTSLLSSSTSGSASSSSGIASSVLALSSPSLVLPSGSTTTTAPSTVQPMTSAAALASLTVPSGSLAPNSPFSSSPSSPYPPPQASSSPSSPSAMSAYPPSLRGSAPGTGAPGSASMAYPPQHSLIEQLRHATGAKRKDSQLALTRKVHSLPYPQAQPNDMELSEDVISLAYRLGKKIYHIDKFAPWLEKHCSPFGSSSSTSPRYGTPRRGNESAHTTAESPIGSPQAPRQMTTSCYAMAPGPSWSVKPMDAPHPATGGVMLAPIVPSLSFASGFPSSAATAAPVPTTTTTTTTTAKPASPSTVPSFTAPYLMVEDLKGQFKTMYKEFPFDSYGCSTVPFLNLDAPPGCSPFLDAETIRKHKEMQRQYQQKLEMRKREKPITPRPKRPTSAPLTRRDLRRPTRERSPPPQAPESTTTAVEMWEGEDGGGMNDSSLQVPHPYRPQMIAPVLSNAASLLPYSLSSTTTAAASAATSASSYQQRRLAPPPTAMSTSSPPAYPSPAFLSPLAAGSSPGSFGAVGTPRPGTAASPSASASSPASAGVSPRHVGRQHAHPSSLLARAHYPPSDHRPRHGKSLSLSAPCFSKADSSGRADTMQSPSEEMEDDVVCLQ